MQGLRKHALILAKVVLAIACFEVIFVLLYHFQIGSQNRYKKEPNGTFIYEEIKDGNREVKGFELYVPLPDDPDARLLFNLKEINETYFLGYNPRFPKYKIDDLFVRAFGYNPLRSMYKDTKIYYEINRNGIFQKTGSLKWRIFQWSFIGGSKANPVVSPDRFVDIFMVSVDTGEPVQQQPLDSTGVYSIFTPFWTTFLLVISFAVLLIIFRQKSETIAADEDKEK